MTGPDNQSFCTALNPCGKDPEEEPRNFDYDRSSKTMSRAQDQGLRFWQTDIICNHHPHNGAQEIALIE